jgi:hypothetical protein
VLKTDLPETAASKQVVHNRYKDLTEVEIAFRTSKTAHLELRPINVRTEEHTRGHVLVVMLAYLIRRAAQRAPRPGVGGVERDGGRGAGAIGHAVLDGGQGGGRRELPEDPGAASCLGGSAQSSLGSDARSTAPSGDSRSHAPLAAVTTTTPLMPVA